jgi:hypothetical protein
VRVVLVITNQHVGERREIVVLVAILVIIVTLKEGDNVRAVAPGLMLDPVNSHNAILSRISREVKPVS